MFEKKTTSEGLVLTADCDLFNEVLEEVRPVGDTVLLQRKNLWKPLMYTYITQC